MGKDSRNLHSLLFCAVSCENLYSKGRDLRVFYDYRCFGGYGKHYKHQMPLHKNCGEIING